MPRIFLGSGKLWLREDKIMAAQDRVVAGRAFAAVVGVYICPSSL